RREHAGVGAATVGLHHFQLAYRSRPAWAGAVGRGLSPPHRLRHCSRRKLFPDVPSLRHTGAGRGLLPAIRRVSETEAAARSAGTLSERVVSTLPDNVRRRFVSASEQPEGVLRANGGRAAEAVAQTPPMPGAPSASAPS